MTDAQKPTPAPMTAPGCLVRLFWMLFGNLILFGAAYSIANHHTSLLSTRDAIFWVTLGLMIPLRYVDIRFLTRRTAGGGPASMKHFTRYVLVILPLAVVLWVVVHVLARSV